MSVTPRSLLLCCKGRRQRLYHSSADYTAKLSSSIRSRNSRTMTNMTVSNISQPTGSVTTNATRSTMSMSKAYDSAKTMQRDVRKTSLWSEVEKYYESILLPESDKSGSTVISNASDLHFPTGLVGSTSHTKISFTGSSYQKVDGVITAICRIYTADLENGQVQHVTGSGIGTSNDVYARWSPDGKKVAFLSDREEKGIFGLYILDVGSLGEARRVRVAREVKEEPGSDSEEGAETAPVEGSAEWLQWSPSGQELLVGFAGRDADTGDAGGSGKVGSGEKTEMPKWMPSVEAETKPTEYRTVAIWNVGTKSMQTLTLSRNVKGTKEAKQYNVWEASWCGDDNIVALVSDGPGEEAWYEADLVLFNIKSQTMTKIQGLRTQHQIVISSPSGKRFASTQGLSSDRGILAGDIVWAERGNDSVDLLEVGSDVTWLAWQDDDTLIYMSNKGLNSVAGEVKFHAGKPPSYKEIWESPEAAGHRGPEGVLLPGSSFGLVLRSWNRPPEIGIVNQSSGKYKTLTSFADKRTKHLASLLGKQEAISWKAPDGLEIHGYIQTPKVGKAPYPLVLNVHGGPVGSFRNTWPGGSRYMALLNVKGYAILNPNPRGSSGRGQEFAERVLGDLGGKETDDHLSGIDMLVENGVVDPDRIGVIGSSHGGFMASWIVTQDARFKASIPICAVNDWHTMHTTSNISTFTRLFFKADPYSVATTASRAFLTQSPVMAVGRSKSKTPVLQFAGAKDLCVSSSQAIQLHHALKENGTESALVVYPEEGHGISKFPALLDASVRIVEWLGRFIPVKD